MIDIYCKLIINKRRTFDQVPYTFRKAVKAKLAELGYDEHGDLTQ